MSDWAWLAVVVAWVVVTWRAARWYYRDRWIPSARVLPDGSHIPVQQTREAPPNERYQEWHPPGSKGRWLDIPLDERGPSYEREYLR